MMGEQIERVRRFNRTIAERVSVLHDRCLGHGRPIGEVRLLWEIGEGGSDVRRLRDRLALDSGYTSRLLRSLEADGLVTVEQSAADRRVRTVRLTEKGRAEHAVLDGRSDELAAEILAPLNKAQRDRLVAAMNEVDLLLTASTVVVDVVDPRHPDGQYCLRGYFAELNGRLATGFDPSHSLQADVSELLPPHGLFLVARLHGDPVGCAGLKLASASEVKRMWVAPQTRGLGLGRRLIAELESRAAANGSTLIRIDTDGAMTAAVKLYRSAGFTEVPALAGESDSNHRFEKRLG